MTIYSKVEGTYIVNETRACYRIVCHGEFNLSKVGEVFSKHPVSSFERRMNEERYRKGTLLPITTLSSTDFHLDV